MSQVSRLLDEEHNGTLALLTALEQAMARTTGVPSRADDDFLRLVGRLHEHLVHHVPRHFGFEEAALFPPLAAAGEDDLCALLQEEHVAINAVIAEVVPLCESVATLDQPSAQALKRGIGELVERLRSHIDKETMALLPACEQCLDPADDQTLALEYAST